MKKFFFYVAVVTGIATAMVALTHANESLVPAAHAGNCNNGSGC